MKGELAQPGGFQLRGVRRGDEWGRKGEGGTSRMHASRHFTLLSVSDRG